MGLKLTVDPARCAGHGQCYAVAPELFTDDTEGFGVPVRATISQADRELALRAQRCCPEDAISVEDAPSDLPMLGGGSDAL
ncbi:ferredoxin [Mycobacterium sp.]|uniref:ferredoxin n=1 Tax=Mycobacterium sp. TaxID=1785 RepID=UPI0033406891|nr:putative ferredoxin [Mycobacterium sp.]